MIITFRPCGESVTNGNEARIDSYPAAPDDRLDFDVKPRLHAADLVRHALDRAVESQ
ncbi:hypothetical protein D1872_257520 [compost metagenome]